MRVYRGSDETNHRITDFALIGKLIDGSGLYVRAIRKHNGDIKLILNEQYVRTRHRGKYYFFQI